MDYQTDDYRLINPVLCIIGTGYVGLVAACCLANSGHQVTCVEADEHKLISKNLRQRHTLRSGMEVRIRECKRARLLM